MQLLPRTQLLALLCWLTAVDSAIIMTAVNATIEPKVVKGWDPSKLGPQYVVDKKVTSVSVSCRLSDTTRLSFPAAQITWMSLDNEQPPVSYVSLTRTESSDGLSLESKLTVSEPQKEKFSAYVCTGSYLNQTANATAAFLSKPLVTISVHGGGNLTNEWTWLNLPDLLIEPYVAATISCRVSGFPIGETKWLKDVNGIETEVAGPVLHFNSSDYKQDRGLYVCRSSNVWGSNSLKIYLRVKNPKAYLTPAILFGVLVAIVIVVIVIDECRLCIMKKMRIDQPNADLQQQQAQL